MTEEQVLAVPRDDLVFAGLGSGLVDDGPTVQAVIEAIVARGDFLARSVVERDPRLLQPIPCAVVVAGSGFLTLQRSEPGKKGDLHNKFVVWLGGHVRQQDCLTGTKSLLLSALYRELEEETGIAFGDFSCMLGLIVPANSRHFAVLFELRLAESLINDVVPNGEFRTGALRRRKGHFVRMDDLVERFASLDSWSKIIVRDIYGHHGKRDESQSSLPGLS